MKQTEMTRHNESVSTDNVAIRVRNLSKCYQIYDNPRDRLKQFVMPRVRSIAGKAQKQYYREFWALRDISFDIRKGETVGIIGRNGSGKSTLLQMICGTLSPSSGSIQTTGRIAALLELGSGFNPEFSGRENVYMNAAVLGLDKEEVDSRFDDIAAFADIGQFMDQSVKTYSSGMVVRLAFAVQSQISPDILIVDEALSVGDAKFQAKCFEQLRKLKENGTSVLLVTHSSEQIVTHCSSAILLSKGAQIEAGEPRHVVNRYLDLLFGKERSENAAESLHIKIDKNEIDSAPTYQLSHLDDAFDKRNGHNPHEYRWGDGGVSITDFCLAADDVPYPPAVTTGQRITLSISIRFFRTLYRPILGITIKTKEGITVYSVNSETLECVEFSGFGRAGSVIEADAEFVCRLAPGDYFISLGVASKSGEEVVPHDRRYDSIHLQVRPNTVFSGLADMGLSMTAKEVAV